MKDEMQSETVSLTLFVMMN